MYNVKSSTDIDMSLYNQGLEKKDMIDKSDKVDISEKTMNTVKTEKSRYLEPTDQMKESANLLYRIPVFLSHPSRLNTVQQQFVDEIIRLIKKEILFPRTLPFTEQYPESPLTNIRRMITSSYGIVALNLRQRLVELKEDNLGQSLTGTIWEGSPFAQIEPGMAYEYGLPLLLIREAGVNQNGIWSFGIAPVLILEWDSTVANPIATFFAKNDWKSIFQNWASQVRSGYYIQTQPQFRYTCGGDSL